MEEFYLKRNFLKLILITTTSKYYQINKHKLKGLHCSYRAWICQPRRISETKKTFVPMEKGKKKTK